MGLLKALIDFFLRLFGGTSESPALPEASSPRAQANAGSARKPASVAPAPADEDEDDDDASAESATGDLAGFDPASDEDAFFEAILYIESAGMIAPNVTITDQQRLDTERKFGIRDSLHWQSVKDACYQVLIRKHGSFEVVMQRQSNFRQGLTQRLMQQTAATKAANGELAPVEGIGLDQWAAMNAAIAQGVHLDDMLKGAGVDKGRWDRASAEWTARMSRDTTFTISSIYGAAFQNASKGKYAEYAKEANAARAANRDPAMQPPMSMEQYWEILYEQAYSAQGGGDPVEALKRMGLSTVDWCDLSTFMGYHVQRTWAAHIGDYQASMARAEAKVSARHPGVKAQVDVAY